MIESERLFYRPLQEEDFSDLKTMLADPQVMYAWEYTFSDEQVAVWLKRQQSAYSQDGAGYFAAVRRDGGQLVGQIGLLGFPYENRRVFEVCYMLKAAYFHQGYALEGALAMTRYAFSRMGQTVVYAQIKTDNRPSIKVAERAGFVRGPVFTKHCNGKDMPHYLYHRRLSPSNTIS